MMANAVLIFGATGKQGGSVIDALLARNADFTLLAVTRNPDSPGSQKLAAKSKKIKLIRGDLDNTPAVFKAAKDATGAAPWGVFSVQTSEGSGAFEREIRQGKAVIDESLAQGVQFLVYTSVDRGGTEASWNNATPVPHFQTKHQIEKYLKDKAGDTLHWTILRPVAFMDNFAPGFPGKVFLTALRKTLKEKPLQFIATSDIGFFAAEAFMHPDRWQNRALSIAGDELNSTQINEVWAKQTGTPLGFTFGFLGSVLRMAVSEVKHMLDWFAAEGYRSDIAECRQIHPGLMNMEQWLESKNNFKK